MEVDKRQEVKEEAGTGKTRLIPPDNRAWPHSCPPVGVISKNLNSMEMEVMTSAFSDLDTENS